MDTADLSRHQTRTLIYICMYVELISYVDSPNIAVYWFISGAGRVHAEESRPDSIRDTRKCERVGVLQRGESPLILVPCDNVLFSLKDCDFCRPWY
jgi:hypothetical protein